MSMNIVKGLKQASHVSQQLFALCLGASVIVAYTNDGYLGDTYRRVTGAYRSIIAMNQGA